VDLAWDFDAIAEVETEFDIDASDWGVVLDDEEENAQNVEDDNFNADSETIETQCQRGDIWQLGEHRLMCGDSTSAEDVARLMDGENAPLTLTDPPYRLITDGGGVFQDSTSMKQVRENGVDEFEPLKLRLYSKTNIYTHNKPLIKDYILLAEREGMAYDLCIYKKPGLPNYNGHLMTDIEYIAIIGEQCPQKGYDFQMYSKVYEGKKDKGNEPSYSKPIGLCQKFIQLYSKQGNIVLDLFGGSGSTLIACEQIDRQCYMIEYEAHYCDVIIKRWETLTGDKAVKIN
jgi:site-specific DNA-methyltransferase (adenine-specific)